MQLLQLKQHQKQINKQCRENSNTVWLYIVCWKYCPFDIWQCMNAVCSIILPDEHIEKFKTQQIVQQLNEGV